MKKKMAGLAILAVSLLLVMPTLTLNIQPVKAEPGDYLVTVQYADGTPRPGAYVFVVNPPLILGRTNATGQINGTLDDGGYTIYARYPPGGPQFGSEVLLLVPGNATITADYEITPPVIEILSPENTTYTTSSVPLTFTVTDYSPISWMGYSLNNQPNATIAGNTTLSGLAIGTHDITVYANDTYGNMGSSNKVYFTKIRLHIVNQTSPACTSGDCYHSTIQDAIYHASDGDTIIVCPGTYNEWVDVPKSLTIKSYSENPTDTIVNASGAGGDCAGFEVGADYVNISGFTVTDFTGFTGSNPAIPNSGILVFESVNANVSNNKLMGNQVGIRVKRSNYTIVENNNVSSNAEEGIWLYYDSNNNTVRFNDVSGNTIGISLGEGGVALNNTIEYNNVFSNTINFWNAQASNVTAEYNWWGTTNCTVIDSKIRDNEEGYGEVDFIPFLNAPLSRWSA